jgi:hypothetical protein
MISGTSEPIKNFWSDRRFPSNHPETAGLTCLLGCEHPSLRITFRSLPIPTGSGIADVMSVAFVAAEVTGAKVALEGYQRRQNENQFG